MGKIFFIPRHSLNAFSDVVYVKFQFLVITKICKDKLKSRLGQQELTVSFKSNGKQKIIGFDAYH